jgi:L-ascorbate metabolism protein UlaG (beta-lactamase superfamily)
MYKITRIVQSCFRIEGLSDLTIYFDPFKIPKDAKKADIITISHSHFDHNSSSSIRNIFTKNTIVICPRKKKRIHTKWNPVGLAVDQSKSVEGAKITAIPMYNTHKPIKFHPKKFELNGYIIEIEGIRFYHPGDCDLIPEMSTLGPIDVAFFPIGGFFTMNIDQAVEATSIINPKYVIPMHENRNYGNLNKFENKLKAKYPRFQVIKLLNNESKTFN